MLNSQSEQSQYLTFLQGSELCGIDISHIREVIEVPKITPLPHSPEYMCGVIDLRGDVVPIIDLKLKLRHKVTEYSADTCIIILELNQNKSNQLFGALADAVNEVISIDHSAIAPAPAVGSEMYNDYVYGVTKMTDSFLVILNSSQLFTERDSSLVGELDLVLGGNHEE